MTADKARKRAIRQRMAASGESYNTAARVLRGSGPVGPDRDFFLSYTQSDRPWAEWIAWVLEEDGFRVLVQAWDFVAGSNWVYQMQMGIRGAARTIALFSPQYLESAYGSAEWQAVWADDPDGHGRRLLPVRVADCLRPGLLSSVVGVDVFGVSEDEARARVRQMVAGATTGRAKPTAAPRFPGTRSATLEPHFPGADSGPQRGSEPVPRPTDARGARGVVVGDGNLQVNQVLAQPAGLEDAYVWLQKAIDYLCEHWDERLRRLFGSEEWEASRRRSLEDRRPIGFESDSTLLPGWVRLLVTVRTVEAVQRIEAEREVLGKAFLAHRELQEALRNRTVRDARSEQEVYRELSEALDRMKAAAREFTAIAKHERLGPAKPLSAFQVGQGAPAWARAFQQVHTALGGISVLGAAVGEVFAEGPGVAQDFEGYEGGPGWVLCGLPGRKPVMVTEAAWEALRRAGRGAFGGQALTAVGFPYLPEDVPPQKRLVGSDANIVRLAGGQWGDGRLVRSAGGQAWRWEPIPEFSSEMTRAARNWTSRVGAPPQLRVRAVATLPWAAGDVAISREARRELAASLPYGKLAGAVTMLSQRRGASVRAGQWQLSPDWPSARDRAAYTCAIDSPDGRPALAVEVMLSLPNASDSAVVTCAELRVEDMERWRETLRAAGGATAGHGDLRLTVPELLEFYLAAWEMATEVLPAAAVPDPDGTPLWGPPKVELRLSAENAQDAPPSAQRHLRDLIDFTEFGPGGRDRLAEMSVTITAPAIMADDERRTLARAALTRMGQDFEFLDASEETL